jgi:hypothetical protein
MLEGATAALRGVSAYRDHTRRMILFYILGLTHPLTLFLLQRNNQCLLPGQKPMDCKSTVFADAGTLNRQGMTDIGKREFPLSHNGSRQC